MTIDRWPGRRCRVESLILCLRSTSGCLERGVAFNLPLWSAWQTPCTGWLNQQNTHGPLMSEEARLQRPVLNAPYGWQALTLARLICKRSRMPGRLSRSRSRLVASLLSASFFGACAEQCRSSGGAQPQLLLRRRLRRTGERAGRGGNSLHIECSELFAPKFTHVVYCMFWAHSAAPPAF